MQTHAVVGFNIEFEPKSYINSCAYNMYSSSQIISQFCTEHGSITVMLCAKFQNDSSTKNTHIQI